MAATTDGVFRVLSNPLSVGEFLLVGVDSGEVTAVRATGYTGELAECVDALVPGNRIVATVAWEGDGIARFDSLSIETRTEIEFVDGASGIFEAALETWEEAERAGEAMNSRVLYGTDNSPNGVVYTFAEQAGERDLYAEFRDGRRPIEPLIERLAEHETPPFGVFVLRPAEEPFVLLTLAIERDGLLAETMRETYGG